MMVKSAINILLSRVHIVNEVQKFVLKSKRLISKFLACLHMQVLRLKQEGGTYGYT